MLILVSGLVIEAIEHVSEQRVGRVDLELAAE